MVKNAGAATIDFMSVARIIDANANRVREALRVLEDAARFVLNDASLSEECKTLRHNFTAVMNEFDYLIHDRDTPGDVGTQITTEGEERRGRVDDIVLAAGKRLGEALRSIEEYLKLIDVDAGAQVKQLRYRAYDIEKKFATRLGMIHSGPAQWKLCLLLTAELCPNNDWRRVAEAALDAGCDCIQLREKNLSDRELVERANELRALTKGRSALIINDRADIAKLCGADGVHLGQNDMRIRDVRRLYSWMLRIGVSAHDMKEVDAAEDCADYLGIGTMFPSPSKPDLSVMGPAFLAAVLEKYPNLPHLAIGGITLDNIDHLVRAGCKGVAVSSAICGAKDPGDVTAAMIEKLSVGALQR